VHLFYTEQLIQCLLAESIPPLNRHYTELPHKFWPISSNFSSSHDRGLSIWKELTSHLVERYPLLQLVPMFIRKTVKDNNNSKQQKNLENKLLKLEKNKHYEVIRNIMWENLENTFFTFLNITMKKKIEKQKTKINNLLTKSKARERKNTSNKIKHQNKTRNEEKSESTRNYVTNFSKATFNLKETKLVDRSPFCVFTSCERSLNYATKMARMVQSSTFTNFLNTFFPSCYQFQYALFVE
ncbi:hypothetical protein L9F63_000459, partial [Diploptera punctata]